LERHTHRSGRDTVDHGKHGSDDYSNSACGVLRLLSRSGEDWLSRWGPALYGRDEWDKMKDDVYARIEEENRAREARYANSR
jgi:hypothetical protein